MTCQVVQWNVWIAMSQGIRSLSLIGFYVNYFPLWIRTIDWWTGCHSITIWSTSEKLPRCHLPNSNCHPHLLQSFSSLFVKAITSSIHWAVLLQRIQYDCLGWSFIHSASSFQEVVNLVNGRTVISHDSSHAVLAHNQGKLVVSSIMFEMGSSSEVQTKEFWKTNTHVQFCTRVNSEMATSMALVRFFNCTFLMCLQGCGLITSYGKFEGEYAGQWMFSFRHGYGELTDPSGSVYAGLILFNCGAADEDVKVNGSTTRSAGSESNRMFWVPSMLDCGAMVLGHLL